jgi:hypothetical protein
MTSSISPSPAIILPSEVFRKNSQALADLAIFIFLCVLSGLRRRGYAASCPVSPMCIGYGLTTCDSTADVLVAQSAVPT